MAEENWHQARLIPTSGINGAEEQERRATSALLAVMSSVREYGQALTKPLGAPSGAVESYIEVPFTLGEQRLYPDGLIRVQRPAVPGQHPTTIAKEHGFDALITISNQIPLEVCACRHWARPIRSGMTPRRKDCEDGQRSLKVLGCGW